MSEDADCPSPTSTVTYEGHEPFETYRHKVAGLCRTLWPSHDESDFSIERMKGGFSNRIIGIRVSDRSPLPASPEASEPPTTSCLSTNFKDPEQPSDAGTADALPPGDYILRIPRFLSACVYTENSLVELAGKHFASSLPRIVRIDTSCESSNPLGKQYSLQHRIPGSRLDDVWDDLNHQQRLSVARDLARFCKEMQAAKNPSGGVPDFDPSRAAAAASGFPTVDFEFIGDQDGLRVPLPAQPPVDMLRARCARWLEFYGRSGSRDGPWALLAVMVGGMQDLSDTWGSPGDEPTYFLYHGDLFPRNIMVAVDGPDSASVTGIVDWDDAHFAPAVVAFAPPAWLWVEGYWANSGEPGSVDESDLWAAAAVPPQSVEAREIKAMFEAAVGPDFLRYAYHREAEIARKIWSGAKESIGKSWVERELEAITEAWFAELPPHTIDTGIAGEGGAPGTTTALIEESAPESGGATTPPVEKGHPEIGRMCITF